MVTAQVKRGRGGAGRGQGRKHKPKIKLDSNLTKDISDRVLSKVDEERIWLEFLHAQNPLAKLTDQERRERMWALERLTNRRYGLPAQQVIAGGKITLEVIELADRSTAKTS